MADRADRRMPRQRAEGIRDRLRVGRRTESAERCAASTSRSALGSARTILGIRALALENRSEVFWKLLCNGQMCAVGDDWKDRNLPVSRGTNLATNPVI